MPPEEVWRGFFDVERILDAMRIDADVTDAADFGCGYGTFTIPAARRIRGVMYAMDIEPEMIRTVEQKSRTLGLTDIRPILTDLQAEGSCLKNESVDYVMLFNILHSEKPLTLLREAFRILRQGGGVGIVHWTRDPATPRGPPLGDAPHRGPVRTLVRRSRFC